MLTATSPPRPAARASQRRRTAAIPRPSSHTAHSRSRHPTAPETAFPHRMPRPARERCRRIRQILGMSHHIDADADRHREPAAVEHRRFQQDAGNLGAGGQHVVRPFQLETVSALACAVEAYGDPAVRHDGVERVGQRQPGNEAERGGKAKLGSRDEQQRRRKIALGRRPGAAAPAAPAFLLLGDDPQFAGIAGPGMSSASALVEPTVSWASSRNPSARASEPAEMPSVRRTSWRRLRHSVPIGPPIST